MGSINFTPDNESDINGAIHWLRDRYFNEINRYVLATSSSTHNSDYKWGGPGALIDYSLIPGSPYSCWCSKDIDISNFSIHFLQHQLYITNYTIHGRLTDFDHISSWTVDGSNDNITWTKVDTKTDDQNLLKKGAIHTFQVDHSGKYRYFRFIHTGKTTDYYKYFFGLCKIDLFGQLIDDGIIIINTRQNHLLIFHFYVCLHIIPIYFYNK